MELYSEVNIDRLGARLLFSERKVCLYEGFDFSARLDKGKTSLTVLSLFPFKVIFEATDTKFSPRIQPYLNLSNLQTLILSPPSSKEPNLPPPPASGSSSNRLLPTAEPSESPPDHSLSLSRTRTSFVPLAISSLILRAPRSPLTALQNWEDLFKLVDPETWKFEGPEPKDGEVLPWLKLLETAKVSGLDTVL